MTDFDIYFQEISFSLPMAFVKGTGDSSFMFGVDEKVNIRINDYYISKFQITQRLWEFVMGNNPSHFRGQNRPVENVSFNDITQTNGFLDKLNLAVNNRYQLNTKLTFRLPSETEWEYAARGGVHWRDDFKFSGSNDINTCAWFDHNSGKYSDPAIISKLKNYQKGTVTHDVGQKSPNQLGIFDMSGNIWEWCQDFSQTDIQKIPADGTPYLQETSERVLRGGCHHNWAIHCTVSKRYGIVADAKDECIGFRIAAGVDTQT